MIATKLIIQSVIGVGALASVVGGSYMLMGNSEEYFLVTSVAEATNKPTEELWTAKSSIPTSNPAVATSQPAANTPGIETKSTPIKNNKTQKNYTCLSGAIGKENTDKTCELYSITFTTDKKALYLKDIQKEIKENKTKKTENQADLIAKKYFLLKTTSTNNWKFDGTDTVKLMSNSKTNEEKVKAYATLTVHGKITADSSSIDTDLIVVKAKTPLTLTPTETSKAYACKFKESEAATVCSINNFTAGAPTTDSNIKDLDWNTLTIPTNPVAPITITQDKYYVIKWSKEKIKESQGKEVIFVENPAPSSQTPAKSAKFEIISSIIGNFETSKQEIIILK